MKKAFLIFVAVMLVISCNGNSIVTKINQQEFNPDLTGKDTGSIYVKFPDFSSKSISFDEVLEKVDIYEFIVYNEDFFLSGTSEDLNSIICVPVGTYKVLVLAGTHDICSISMLGSGVFTDVEVVQDQRTNIQVAIKPVSHEFYIEDDIEEVVCSDYFKVVLEGNTNNSLLSLSPHIRLCLQSKELGIDLEVIEEGSKFKSEKTIQAPIIPGEDIINLCGSNEQIKLDDPEYNLSVWLSASITNKDWIWIIEPNWHEKSSKSISYVEDPTGIGLEIIWENPSEE